MNEEMLIKEIEMLRATVEYQDKIIDKLRGERPSLKKKILKFLRLSK